MNERRTVVLDELDQMGEVVHIDAETAGILAATDLVEVRLERSGCRLLPRGRVGSVRIGHLQVDILPKDKVGFGSLLFLLGYARNPGLRPETVESTRDPDLWPLLAESLVRFTRRAVGPGVLQGYRTVEGSERIVRGRIRIGDQVRRHPGIMVPIEVTYDEFTVDIPENRILRTALRRMLTVPRLDPATASMLAHFDGRLEGAAVLTPGQRRPDYRLTRLNDRYGDALRLAEIVLDTMSTTIGDVGGLPAAAFVVDMARVYEDFITTALRESLVRYSGDTVGQYRVRLDEPNGSPALLMYPDVVHLIRSAPVLVLDAKYKAADANGRYGNADHYQMLAYCTALQLPVGWLVYAGRGTKKLRRIVNTGVVAVEYPVDISGRPREVLRRIDELADECWRLRCDRARHQAVRPQTAIRAPSQDRL